MLTRVNIRSERRGGQILKEMARDGQREGQGGDRKSNLQSVSLKLKEIGITHIESHRWQKIAGVPKRRFGHLIPQMQDAGELAERGDMETQRRDGVSHRISVVTIIANAH